jgi:hypothetical protein
VQSPKLKIPKECADKWNMFAEGFGNLAHHLVAWRYIIISALLLFELSFLAWGIGSLFPLIGK